MRYCSSLHVTRRADGILPMTRLQPPGSGRTETPRPAFWLKAAGCLCRRSRLLNPEGWLSESVFLFGDARRPSKAQCCAILRGTIVLIAAKLHVVFIQRTRECGGQLRGCARRDVRLLTVKLIVSNRIPFSTQIRV